ncbi:MULTISPECIES: hypothetical protein [unclassified Streptomyces]|uniref:hypothetical protein n=1 Tax=unclassified Streptomyces TaxID=2593676 RepID=UPI00131A26D4|nr:hypothetical protein [Streptomyces sp. BoleA5]MYX34378.1 hypothetical protein [Streptomyces sp. SID8377]
MADLVTGEESFPSVDLPTPERVLADTDWASLWHAYGPAADVPAQLPALFSDDQNAREAGLQFLFGTVHHQGTLYEATVPVALYVASILRDPRTNLATDQRLPLRAELLAWIASVGQTASDDLEDSRRENGFPLAAYPQAVAIRKMRPLLFTTAFDLTEDPDRRIREAAIAACIPLMDDPQLQHHRAALVPPVRQVLGTSELWQHRERAIDALDAWGEDSSGLEGQQNPFEFCDSDLPPIGTSVWTAGPWSSTSDADGPPF